MFPANTRILVIDDMVTMRKLVVRSLKTIGFSDFIEACDGEQGWAALSSSEVPVGIVISDWNMPNCTGIELLKRVRGQDNYKNLPFILLTAESESVQVMEALKLGVTGYIVKPFTIEVLKEKLTQAYQKAAA